MKIKITFLGLFFLLHLTLFAQQEFLDSTFNQFGANPGKVLLDTLYQEGGRAITLNNGKIYMATGQDNSTRLHVVCLNHDGTPSMEFNSNTTNKARIDVNGSSIIKHISPRKIAIQRDGKILVGGFARNFQDSLNLMVLRLNTDGTLDSNYGTNGFYIEDFGGNESVADMELRRNDLIIVGSQQRIQSPARTMVVLLDADGRRSLAFNNSTGAYFTSSAGSETPTGLHIDNTYILFGGYYNGSGFYTYLVKLPPDRTKISYLWYQ